MNLNRWIGVASAVLLANLLFTLSFAHAQSSGLEDCPSMNLEVELDGHPLTAEEMLQLLEARLYESGPEFEECLRVGYQQAASTAAAASAAAASMASEDEAEGESGSTQATGQSLGEGNDESQGESESLAAASGGKAEAGAGVQELEESTQGKIPDDIPPVDNDDAFMKQLRTAAMDEKDPAKQAELWNLYRSYKGLPQK